MMSGSSRADGTISTTPPQRIMPALILPLSAARGHQSRHFHAEIIIVELRRRARPRRRRNRRCRRRSGTSPTPATGLFEDQLRAVYAVRIQHLVDMLDFHRHAYDGVTVFVSGGLVAIQVQANLGGRPRKSCLAWRSAPI